MTPLPVLIIGTYDADGNPDAMNAAWGTQCGCMKNLHCCSMPAIRPLLILSFLTISLL